MIGAPALRAHRKPLGRTQRAPARLAPGGERPGRWLFRQVRDDPDAGREWAIVCEVDLVESEGVTVVHTVGPDRL